ncbi:tRNA (adenosine(37)-N6)-threonylcarbamoyltransferase complex dimerization subunit type 1 TsaB [Ancylobacter sp. Lp-2]|uniref:tRNA (adenosine(37)-N6)-threonylcarbamoyltransferase complex dimerization subunit type 1 TsaB n=1 Tax=Ancylobacter sp. Lp-2 TaxID=2881339 RepID=UPI001E4A7A92|nr:tRNA (adenosine(37)-N6)-threonylcarbamoyltransferase complex dimerization subunit type 1 TsaB [Ancylobacter sp. Lp-2]MCB4767588.1 tRNA (adenosine(37)-N6)-threonylcarbamoyltransferase complex dimerization subunit type 1 TsaB [Ancylobacter sp. Lp-2]
MLILALDTALEACSVALHDVARDETLARASQEMSRGHAEALVPMVDQVMVAAGRVFADIGMFAVTVGPGSFTGLRVGLSAARGFGLAQGRPVIGITTLATLAAPLLALDDGVPVVAAIDARHDNLYVQMIGPGGRVMVSPRQLPLKEAVRAVAGGAVRLVGSGAPLIAAAWPDAAPAPVEVATTTTPDPVWLARLAAVADPAKSEPRPLYLRDADAKPQTAARIARR